MPNIKTLDKITLRRNNIDEPYYISNSFCGYYNEQDGKFYKESTFTTEITILASRLVYVDLATNYIYRYDDLNSKFVQIGGSGSGLEYVDTLPSPPDIKDTIYGHYSTDTNSMRFYAGDEDNQVLYLLSNEGSSTQPLFIDSENYISIDYDLI